METKRVQATGRAPPAMYQAQTRGFNMLVDIAALGLPYQATGVATTRKFIRERTDVVRRYIKAHIEAVHRFKTDRETSMKVLGKSLALSDKQLIERTYDGAIVEHKLPAKQYPTLEGLKTILASDPKQRERRPKTSSISVSSKSSTTAAISKSCTRDEFVRAKASAVLEFENSSLN